MKNIFHFVSIFLLSSLFIFAQNKSDNFDDWEVFSPENEEFSIELPDMDFDCHYSEVNYDRKYQGLFEGTYFFIFSDKLKQPVNQDVVLSFVGINQKSELEKQKNSPELKFDFSDDENFYHRIYIAKTKKRVYTFHLISPVKNDPLIKHFFDNLKINEQAVAEAPDEREMEINNNITVIDSTEDKKEGSNGRGVGQGSGFGDGGFGIGTKNKSEDSVNKIQAKPLNITYKPKPKYTDFARFYNITGNVRVRTTFSKDGTISSTTPLSRLPFGLTNSAITAAKQMRFEPMIANGQAVSVTKVVVFTFTIY